MLKRSWHAPAHLLIDHSVYFVTSAIYQKRTLLKQAVVKQHLLTAIEACLTKKNWRLDHWVILDNHYHLLVTSNKGEYMPKIFRKIHGLSARFIQTGFPLKPGLLMCPLAESKRTSGLASTPLSQQSCCPV